MARFALTVIDPAPVDFDNALFYVEQLGELTKGLSISVQWIADGKYPEDSMAWSQSRVRATMKGDKRETYVDIFEDSDEAERMAEAVAEIDSLLPLARAAIDRCHEPLAIQNDRLTEDRDEPKPAVDWKPVDSAHEALYAIALQLAVAVRNLDHDEGDEVEVATLTHIPPINVTFLRANLPEGSKWIIEQGWAPNALSFDLLLADARWECRQAKDALSKGIEPARKHDEPTLTKENVAVVDLQTPRWQLEAGGFRFNGGTFYHTTPLQNALLRAFVESPNKSTFSLAELRTAAWPPDTVNDDSTVRQRLSELRSLLRTVADEAGFSDIADPIPHSGVAWSFLLPRV